MSWGRLLCALGLHRWGPWWAFTALGFDHQARACVRHGCKAMMVRGHR